MRIKHLRLSMLLPILSVLLFAVAATQPALAQSKTGQTAVITDYTIAGTGVKTLLLLPCMSCNWREFDKFIEANMDRYIMYAVTMPGFGGSELPDLPMYSDRPLWQENAVAALKNFVDDHNLDDVVVVGHSWGAIIGTQLLAEYPDFADSFIIMDNFIPFNANDQALPYDQKVKLVEGWYEQAMKPLRDYDEWVAFNLPNGSYFAEERRIHFFGMFMATPKDVLFQYWRENGLQDINDMYASLSMPVLEIKSISPRQPDPTDARLRYLAQYETAPHPKNLETVFLFNSGHYQLEHHFDAVNDMIWKYVSGQPVSDVDPLQ